MQTSLSTPKNRSGAAGAVLTLAKHLQRAATAQSLSLSLPVLRRILVAGVLRGISLPQLRRQRAIVQRKHLLRMLAVEAGFSGWEPYSHALRTMDIAGLPHFDAHRGHAGDLNLWFSSPDQAQAYALEFGGQAMAVGRQAVVLAAHPGGEAPPAQASPPPTM